ncbi:MAG TPA: hypothetical protein PKJ17_00840 [Syntrophorhabdaceae bacterium]|nr:hypothetical protein [Syntrophorhabdaceae bacterium]
MGPLATRFLFLFGLFRNYSVAWRVCVAVSLMAFILSSSTGRVRRSDMGTVREGGH